MRALIFLVVAISAASLPSCISTDVTSDVRTRGSWETTQHVASTEPWIQEALTTSASGDDDLPSAVASIDNKDGVGTGEDSAATDDAGNKDDVTITAEDVGHRLDLWTGEDSVTVDDVDNDRLETAARETTTSNSLNSSAVDNTDKGGVETAVDSVGVDNDGNKDIMKTAEEEATTSYSLNSSAVDNAEKDRVVTGLNSTATADGDNGAVGTGVVDGGYKDNLMTPAEEATTSNSVDMLCEVSEHVRVVMVYVCLTLLSVIALLCVVMVMALAVQYRRLVSKPRKKLASDDVTDNEYYVLMRSRQFLGFGGSNYFVEERNP